MGLIRGNAAFTWVDTTVSMTEQVLLLREPIREIRPAHRQSVYASDSLDFQVRQVFTIGTGVDELVCRVRFVDDPQGLLNMIKAGTKNVTLVYHPDLDDPLRVHSYKLISPLSPMTLGMDPDTGVSFGDVDVELVLRETS
jgi:hypothetical protein